MTTLSMFVDKISYNFKSQMMMNLKLTRKPSQMSLPASSVLQNDAFRHNYPQSKNLIPRQMALQEETHLPATVADWRLTEIRTELQAIQAEEQVCITAMEDFSTRPYFSRQLPDDVHLGIVGRVGHWGSQKVAGVCRDFRATVEQARELRLYGGQGLSISAGKFHTVISVMGRVYTCGGNRNEEVHPHYDGYLSKADRAYLGHGDVVNELVPRLVEALVGVNVVGIAAGYWHTVVWTDEGKAYSFGEGAGGRLGHGDDRELLPRLIEGVLVRKRVVGVSAGGNHTVVWTDEGKAYSFGYGRDGKLGQHGGNERELMSRLVEGGLVGKRVVGVSAGGNHTVVWTDEGKAYSFGYGESGKLGHGSEEDEPVPRLIEGVLVGKRVVGMASGHEHTVVRTDEGKAYSFGNGWCCKLGHGDSGNELVPRLIECVLVGKRVVGVSAGEYHTVVWTDEGKAYSFGNGIRGRLGHQPSTEPQLVPRLIEGVLVGKRVVGVAAGADHTVVWTDEGKAYSFGDGECGVLGHGCSNMNEPMPRLIECFISGRMLVD